MRNNEQYKRLVLLGMSCIILAALTAVYAYCWYEFYAPLLDTPFFRKGNWLVVGIYALQSLLFTMLYGGYKIGYLTRSNVVYSQILSMVVVNGLTYLQLSLISRQFVPVGPLLSLLLVDLILIFVWVMASFAIYQKLYPPRRMLLIYGGSRLEQSLVEKMNRRKEKYQIVEELPVSLGMPALQARILEHEAVILCDVKSEDRNRLLKFCFEHSIRTYITPKISDLILRYADDLNLFDVPLLLCRNNGLRLEQRLLKRAMDIVVSLLALLVLSPFMLVIAIAIKLNDGGPILFRQDRLTLDGRVFSVYKFRSMKVNAEKETGAVLAQQNDDRITAVGRVIRAIRLDEAPQFINILKGDMSIVGPRPERPELAKQHLETMPEFNFRLKVKAGLTGYAQVIGRYNTSAYDKLKLDMMYICNYSFFLDIKLILMTIKILFMKESTEGIEKAREPQTTAKR